MKTSDAVWGFAGRRVPGEPFPAEGGRVDASGNVQFVCGFAGPEDLVIVPGGQLVIASGDAAPGAITLIHVNDTFNFSTVAIQLGKELWVGSVRGDRVARFPMP
jgi:hypothetical protein